MPDKIVPLRANDVCTIYIGSVPIKNVAIIDIRPDNKKGWWWITLQTLEAFSHPFQWNWLLDDDHLNQEVFEMAGIPHRLVKVGTIDSPKEKKEISKSDYGTDTKLTKELF